MAPNARVSPFAFEDFAGGPKPQAEAAPVFDEAALNEAYQRGLAEGQARAAADISARQAEALNAVAAALALQHSAAMEGLAKARLDLENLAARFLARFCGAHARDREIDIAIETLLGLMQDDQAGGRLTLRVPSDRLSHVGGPIRETLDAAGRSDQVDLIGDSTLNPGECRIEWRGGCASRTDDEIAAAIAALFPGADAMHAPNKETTS